MTCEHNIHPDAPHKVRCELDMPRGCGPCPHRPRPPRAGLGAAVNRLTTCPTCQEKRRAKEASRGPPIL